MRKLYFKNLTFSNRLARLVWNVVWIFLFRFSPSFLFSWRRFLLCLFGAKIGKNSKIYPTVKIWAPWNLKMGEQSTLAPNVDCYSVDKIVIGSFTTVSQYSYLCTASHDYIDPCIEFQPQMPLLSAPIELGSKVWITADVFVGPGVCVGDGVVVLARSTVIRDLPPWTVASGNPALVRENRILRSKNNAAI